MFARRADVEYGCRLDGARDPSLPHLHGDCAPANAL